MREDKIVNQIISYPHFYLEWISTSSILQKTCTKNLEKSEIHTLCPSFFINSLTSNTQSSFSKHKSMILCLIVSLSNTPSHFLVSLFYKHVSITFALCGITPKSIISAILPEGQSTETLPTPRGVSKQREVAKPRLPSSSFRKKLSEWVWEKKYRMDGRESKVRIDMRHIMYMLKLKKAFTP